MRKDFSETFKDVKQDLQLQDLLTTDFNSIKLFIDKAIIVLSDRILACKNETEFIKVLIEIGDMLYDGNKIAKQNKNIFKKILFKISEKYDNLIFNEIIKFIDKKFLDKHLGENWFEKLQEKARSFKTVISIDRELE